MSARVEAVVAAMQDVARRQSPIPGVSIDVTNEAERLIAGADALAAHDLAERMSVLRMDSRVAAVAFVLEQHAHTTFPPREEDLIRHRSIARATVAALDALETVELAQRGGR
jgi:hypothetical protein